MAAGTVLNSLYPKLFHVTCVAHLLYKWVMKVKSHFHNVDQLIAKTKAATAKNKTDKHGLLLFATHLSLLLQGGEAG